MQKLITLLVLMASLCMGAYATSIYDVQFSTSSGSDGTYPSRFLGKTVTLEGIITATNYRTGGYFISERLNGPWRGILIADRDAKVQTGDYVRVSGTVSETYGMTCLMDISSANVISSNNPLPQPVILTTGQLSRADEAEAYEGVYARLLNTTATNGKNLKGKIQVTDGSGTCLIIPDLFGGKTAAKSPNGVYYSSVTGVVVFGFSEFALGPVTPSDIIIQQPKFIQNRSWGKIKSIYK